MNKPSKIIQLKNKVVAKNAVLLLLPLTLCRPGRRKRELYIYLDLQRKSYISSPRILPVLSPLGHHTSHEVISEIPDLQIKRQGQ